MKWLYYAIGFLILFFSSCNEKEQVVFPLLITSPYDTLIHVNVKEMQVSQPVIYAINIKDSLNLSLKKFYKKEDYSDYFSDSLDKDTDSLKLFVDSKNKSFHSDELLFFNLKPPPLPPKFLDSLKQHHKKIYEKVIDTVAFRKNALKRKNTHYSTLPVFLYNNSTTNKLISNPALEKDLFLLVEAKDKKGDWKPIEYNYVPGFICGSGIKDYNLKPRHFMVSAIKNYKGHYKTKLRVKLMTSNNIIYSNEFNGEINYSQFNFPEQVRLMYQRYSDSTNLNHINKRKLIFLNY